METLGRIKVFAPHFGVGQEQHPFSQAPSEKRSKDTNSNSILKKLAEDGIDTAVYSMRDLDAVSVGINARNRFDQEGGPQVLVLHGPSLEPILKGQTELAYLQDVIKSLTPSEKSFGVVHITCDHAKIQPEMRAERGVIVVSQRRDEELGNIYRSIKDAIIRASIHAGLIGTENRLPRIAGAVSAVLEGGAILLNLQYFLFIISFTVFRQMKVLPPDRAI